MRKDLRWLKVRFNWVVPPPLDFATLVRRFAEFSEGRGRLASQVPANPTEDTPICALGHLDLLGLRFHVTLSRVDLELREGSATDTFLFSIHNPDPAPGAPSGEALPSAESVKRMLEDWVQRWKSALGAHDFDGERYRFKDYEN